MSTTLTPSSYPHGQSDMVLMPPFAGRFCEFTLDSSYPNSGGNVGYILSVAGLRTVEEVILLASNSGYVLVWDPSAGSNGRLRVYRTAAQGSTTALRSYAPGAGDIKGSANTDSENTDAASAPTNGTLISAGDTITNITEGGVIPTPINPDVARNVCVTVDGNGGGDLPTAQPLSIAVVGTFRGAAQTETITFTSTGGNKTIANTKFRYKYGTKPFDSITSMTVTGTTGATAGLKIAAGIGSKLGTPTALANAATTDVKKLTKTAADLATTSIVSATAGAETVNFGTLANGDDCFIEYLETVAALDAAALLVEVANGVSLSTITARALVLGSR